MFKFTFLCDHIYGPWETIHTGNYSYMIRYCSVCDKQEKIFIGR